MKWLNNNNTILCPRCKSAMRYVMESENLSDGTRRVVYYYKCLHCGLRIEDLHLRIIKNRSSITLHSTKNKAIQTIITPHTNNIVKCSKW